MDSTFTVSDGTTPHVFGMISLSAGKSERSSRQAPVNAPVKVVVQQATKANIQRSNLKFSVAYTNAQGIVKIAQRSVADTFDTSDCPATVLAQVDTLTKNFLADATLASQFRHAEL